MSLSRNSKLLTIALACGLLGVLIAQAIGAVGTVAYLAVVLVPVVIGLAIGLIALNPNGGLRNRGILMTLLVSILVAAAGFVALVVQAIYSSTDL